MAVMNVALYLILNYQPRSSHVTTRQYIHALLHWNTVLIGAIQTNVWRHAQTKLCRNWRWATICISFVIELRMYIGFHDNQSNYTVASSTNQTLILTMHIP